MNRIIIFGVLSFFSLTSFAETNYTHEFFIGTGGAAQAQFSFQPGQTNYGVTTGYNYRLSTDFQIGVDGSITYYSSSSYSSNSSTSYFILVGPTYNFSNDKGDIADSFFLYFNFGIFSSSNSYSEPGYPDTSYTSNDGAWVAGAGKRFKLAENVSFRPFVRVLYTAPVNYVVVQIVPLSFGINF